MQLIRTPVRPRLNPAIVTHVTKRKFASWRSFLDEAYWNIELED